MKQVRPLLLSRSAVLGGLGVAFFLLFGTAVLTAFSTYELTSALQPRAMNADASEAVARAQTLQVVTLSLIAIAAALALAGARLLLGRKPDLEALITICAWTQRVWWQGRWLSFEDFLAKRFNVFCTHGICDEAAANIRREAQKEIEVERRR